MWRKAVCADSSAAWRALDAGYNEPQRAYHNWAHIGVMLSGLDDARLAREFDEIDFDAVELTIFFHDAIYDPRAKDNEERSAALFSDMCAGGASNQERMQRVVDMIQATAMHAATTDLATRLLLDLDLRVLGGGPERYLAYVDAVRAEYSFVPDEAWRDGRSAVLTRFLERDRIFQTGYFARLYEARARKNIATELEALVKA
ncbi:MAG: hypothetical protein AB7P20_25305 [Rhizobiaceae bacterium]